MGARDHPGQGAPQNGGGIPRGLLRVGVVVDERDFRRWQATALSEVARSGLCEVTVFTGGSAGDAPMRGLARRLREAARHWLFHAYERADRRWFGSADDPLARTPLEPCLGAVARLVRVRGAWASGAHVGTVADAGLDVVLCLAPGVSAGGLAGCARFGAWSLHAGGLRGRREAHLFREMSDGGFVGAVTLRANTPADGQRTIYRSLVQADQVSLHRSRCEAFRRAAHLPARRLRDLHRRGWGFIAEHPAYAEEHPAPAPRHQRPTNATMLRFLGRLARRVLGHRLGALVHRKEWFLAYRRLGPGPLDRPVTTIVPPPGRFYADPFLFSRDGRRFIFFEDYDRRREAAEICYVEIDEQGRHSAPRPALRRDCHLSYPFVFAEGDEVYMLPETAGHRTVELYRATSFPDEWTLERVLLSDLSARDATLLRHDGRFWLFVAIDVDGTRPIDELFLFSSDSLLGEWEPHPLNPVVTDVRSARSAGRIFRRDGHLVRPAQDCSRAYGWRLVFNRIETLTATDYREVPVGAIEPAPGSCTLRTHSYDSDGEYEVLDAFRMRPKAGIGPAPEGPLCRRVEFEPSRVEPSAVAGVPW